MTEILHNYIKANDMPSTIA